MNLLSFIVLFVIKFQRTSKFKRNPIEIERNKTFAIDLIERKTFMYSMNSIGENKDPSPQTPDISDKNKREKFFFRYDYEKLF